MEDSVPKPVKFLPDNCFELNLDERNILTMYRNLSKRMQREFYALSHYTFKSRKSKYLKPEFFEYINNTQKK